MRESFYKRSDVDNSYWDLSDYNNEHYRMLGLPREKVIRDILNTMFDNDGKKYLLK